MHPKVNSLEAFTPCLTLVFFSSKARLKNTRSLASVSVYFYLKYLYLKYLKVCLRVEVRPSFTMQKNVNFIFFPLHRRAKTRSLRNCKTSFLMSESHEKITWS